MILKLFLCGAMALGAFAADINGKWVASMTTPDGQKRESTYNFKADGSTLTGTVSGRGGETAISDGKVDGDNISFTVVRNFNGNEMKQKYTGKLEGDSLKLKFQMREREMEITAKRAGGS